MKTYFASLFPRLALVAGVLLLAACAAASKGPITQVQAVDIARKVTIKQERWPKGQVPPSLIEVLSCQAKAAGGGNWKVTVTQAIMEKATKKTVLVPGSKRTVLLSGSGKVLSYSAGSQ